jgi:hypothetical protein
MSAAQDHAGTANLGINGNPDLEKATKNMSHDERNTALHAARFGYGPLAHIRTAEGESTLPGERQDLVIELSNV